MKNRNYLYTFKKNTAFTLAEVLITLGIIGVVAAMTIPVLMTKINEIVFNSQFRSMYAKLQQGMRQIIADGDEGVLEECFSSETWNGGRADKCNEVADKLTQTMKLSICKRPASKRGCIPENYHGFDDAYKNKNETTESPDRISCGGFFGYHLRGYSDLYILPDGSFFNIYNGNQNAMLIDINGAKGPNRWGYDIFTLSFQRRAVSGEIELRAINSCFVAEKGGKTTAQMMQQIK